MNQIPIGPILLLLAGFGTLFVLLTYVFMNRSRRPKNASPETQTESGVMSTVTSRPGTGDLPDLDSLLGIDTNAVPARKSTFSVRLQDGGTVEAAEVLVIMRDITTGDLIVEMNGKAYRDLKRIASDDPELQRRYTNTLRDLSSKSALVAKDIAFGEAPASSVSQEEPATSSDAPPDFESGDAPMPDLHSLTGMSPAAATYNPPAHTSNPLPPGSLPGDLPSFKLPDASPIEAKRGLLGGVRGPKKQEFQPVPEINIAAAIEAYLQHKIVNTPEWKGRNIHVHPANDGVRIQVDTMYYEAVGEVEDPIVREFLAATIQEWQERH
ncbi:MAG: hypothetical protein H7175_15200 [Burkholderiales bacterium]|nr:hypothetical protein [Anaerolineae bacterium]